MMRRIFPKPTTKYALIGVVVVIIIALILVYIFVFAARKIDLTMKGSLTAKLEDSSIESNSSTFLLIGGKNTGSKLLTAEFRVTPDDWNAVIIEYPNPELLKLKLLPKESVVRRMEVTGLSKAIRTDFEILVELVGENETVIDKETIVLTVRK